MNAHQLRLNEGPLLNLWRCGKCFSVDNSPERAGKCCDWRCSACGCNVSNFYTRCDACSRELSRKKDQEVLDKATILPDYDGWVYCISRQGPQDGYFPSLEEFIEYVEGSCECDIEKEECSCLPEYVHTCVVEVKELDVSGDLQSLCEDGYEDMYEGLYTDELYKAVDKFNEDNKERMELYNVDTKHKIYVGTGNWWRGTCKCDICGNVQESVIEIPSNQDSPTVNLECGECHNMSARPVEE